MPDPREQTTPPVGEQPPLPAHASVLIVGGGVMGCSIAFHLAEAGVRDVVLLERDRLGSGSSAKPLGGVRATFSDPGNILLGRRSLEAYEGFAQRFGVDIGLRQVGYLFLCRSEQEVAAVAASTEVQNALGCDSRMISPAAAAVLNPLVAEEALLAASFSPRDGFARPSRVVAGYAAAARRAGVTVLEDTEVHDVVRTGRTVEAVRTDRGTIRVDVLVIAAGAWSSRLGAMAGVHLPIEPVRRQIGFTPTRGAAFPVVPFTLDLSTTLYFHNYDGGMVLGISDPDQAPGFGRDFDRGWTGAFDRAAEVVAPSLAGSPLTDGWAGLYENTPDHNAVIGVADGVDGVVYAAGFSGHGFLQAPAVGELVRDLVLQRTPFMDPAPFDAARFAAPAAPRTEIHII